ncbi:MAG: hypothetical protein AABY78_02005 [Nitrospirota bacterium]|jgi:hypothetical protein
MKYGKKNIVFGFGYLIFTLLLGLFLSYKLQSDQPFAKEPFAFPRVIMRAAHAHGNLESILSIIIGLIVDRLRVSDSLKKTISILAIFGAIMHSGMLYIMPVVTFSGNLALIGALSLITTTVLMAYSVSKGLD